MPQIDNPLVSSKEHPGLHLELIASYPHMRALAWDNEFLYAARGYSLLRADMTAPKPEWKPIANYKPASWRNSTSKLRLTSRMFRDGFHALGKLSRGDLVAAVPGAIVRLDNGISQFHISHKITRGTRPLHITITPDDSIYWGEYFDNPQRQEVYIYASADGGHSWNVAHAFLKNSVRHVHNIVYDRWQNCLWVLTGDHGAECRILRASIDFKNVELILSGNQQARAVACIATRNGLYFATDTPLEKNYIYHLDRAGKIHSLSPINSSCIYGCQVRNSIFFSTMVEPSDVNIEGKVCVFGSTDRSNWLRLLEWKKDRWPMRLFQYGNAMLPDGTNATDFLAVSTIAVQSGDLSTSIWRVVAEEGR